MKKFLSILLLIVGLFFINSPFVYAKENIMIKDIRIVEHSDTATVDNITYENNKWLYYFKYWSRKYNW